MIFKGRLRSRSLENERSALFLLCIHPLQNVKPVEFMFIIKTQLDIRSRIISGPPFYTTAL